MTPNFYHNKLTVICEKCGERYEIPLSKGKKQILIIDYAVCPHCKEPRNPLMWQYKDIVSDICEECGVPFSRVARHGRRTCVMCYFRKRRENKGRVDYY